MYETVSADDSVTYTANGLLEQINVTRDSSDYLWYLPDVNIQPNERFLKNEQYPVLAVMSAGHALQVFINGQLSGHGPGMGALIAGGAAAAAAAYGAHQLSHGAHHHRHGGFLCWGLLWQIVTARATHINQLETIWWRKQQLYCVNVFGFGIGDDLSKSFWAANGVVQFGKTWEARPPEWLGSSMNGTKLCPRKNQFQWTRMRKFSLLPSSKSQYVKQVLDAAHHCSSDDELHWQYLLFLRPLLLFSIFSGKASFKQLLQRRWTVCNCDV
ncbi:hypothetical protein Vadar_026249 [Vaccinium darrowii]|uniref:Uncharacterized protein n=1 Tax=Vaccinium darrowii TaxID=229202 RepID=A0ACB7XU19_9ERIC|nr:hypothetical protein Vadar_026249 [Vaccinium darrowii]